eukprot:10503048-Ditylum_brightwellii.AAC.1
MVELEGWQSQTCHSIGSGCTDKPNKPTNGSNGETGKERPIECNPTTWGTKRPVGGTNRGFLEVIFPKCEDRPENKKKCHYSQECMADISK